MQNQPYEKVDLLYVLLKVIRFVKTAKRNIVISILIGLVIGSIYGIVKAPVYRSQLTAYSTHLNSEQVSDVMTDLAKLIVEKDFVQLNQKTGMSDKMLKKVVAIQCKPHITLESLKKENGDDGTFNITVEVTDIGILDSLENGIMYYLESNPYIQKRVRLKLEGIEIDMVKIGKEMSDLESLKLDMQTLMRNKDGRSNLFLSDAGNISAQVIELFQKYSSLNYEKQFAGTDIRVIKSFTKFKQKVAPNILLSIIGSVIISVTIGIGIFLSKSFMRVIRDSNV